MTKIHRPAIKRSGPRLDRLILMQSKMLESHEGTIARHTKIQSVIALVAVVITIVTTFAVASITFLQLRANERQVTLEEARSANRYTTKIEYRTPRGDVTTYTYGWQPVVPYSLTVARVSGESTVTGLFVFQEMELHTSVDSLKADRFDGCVVLVVDWFEGDPQTFATPLNAEAASVYERMVYASPDNHSVIINAGNTEIYVKYFDVYGIENTDKIVLNDENVTVARSIKPKKNDDLQSVVVEYQPDKIVPFRSIFSGELGKCGGLITPAAS